MPTSSSTAPGSYDQSGFWYEDGSQELGAAVLNALRRYRQAERDMRARTRLSMRMGETDLAAIRILLREQHADRTVNATQLASHLGITSASTASLISRLEKSGHIQRRSNPTDRRGVFLTASESSDDEVRTTMAGMHARMILSAQKLRPELAHDFIDFLQELTAAVDSSVPAGENERRSISS